tara:strand:+ start:129555 stop:129704 length:150 start_codon:yes stop_codon:yes gene_type:complete
MNSEFNCFLNNYHAEVLPQPLQRRGANPRFYENLKRPSLGEGFRVGLKF